MMMPANFSAISENEMTYVEGGAVALADILAPVLKVSNWQTFNTNMVTIIGNSYMNQYVQRTVGTLFSGSYVPGQMASKWHGLEKYTFNAGAAATGATADSSTGKKFLAFNNGLLNAGLQMMGNAAAIYNLATGTVKNAAEGAAITAKPAIEL